jgi:hypothetical protein
MTEECRREKTVDWFATRGVDSIRCDLLFGFTLGSNQSYDFGNTLQFVLADSMECANHALHVACLPS